MRIFAKVTSGESGKEETLVVACTDTSRPVSSIVEELKAREEVSGVGERYQLRLAENGAILNDKSRIEDVLKDDDVVLVALQGAINGEKWIALDGHSLRVEDLVKIGKGKYRVKLSEEAKVAVSKARKVVDDIVASGKVVYGINTGFGRFANIVISHSQLDELQVNLLRSHSAGVGDPLGPAHTRMLLALRINALAKGYSGVRLETLEQMVDALNEKGTVGASGDLAPLSHLALGLCGEGDVWSPTTGWGKAKEGLSLINGTQMITSLGADALHRAKMAALQADIIAALSIDVLKGTPRAFDPDIHTTRIHPGQQEVAARLCALLDSSVYPSEIREGHRNCSKVQDAYTLRCVPQVHGVVHDTIKFVTTIITAEMNSATDNPMVFVERGETISGGNFHGEYPAKALDYLAIAIHEIANMTYSEMPAFLVQDGGLNSGFMVAQCTAASLVSENKVLTHPSSVDSITTSAGTEDHVSMGGFAARKAITVVEHVETVTAIELLAACQGLEFHRPNKTTAPLEAVYKLVRTVVGKWDKDRRMSPDIMAVRQLLRDEKVWQVVQPYLDSYQSNKHCPIT
eukprot:Em0001g2004a